MKALYDFGLIGFAYLPTALSVGFVAWGIKKYYDAHSNQKEIEYLQKGYKE